MSTRSQAKRVNGSWSRTSATPSESGPNPNTKGAKSTAATAGTAAVHAAATARRSREPTSHTASPPASRTIEVGASRLLIAYTDPSSRPPASSSSAASARGRMLTPGPDTASCSTQARKVSEKGVTITWACRSPRRKLKNGNSLAVPSITREGPHQSYSPGAVGSFSSPAAPARSPSPSAITTATRPSVTALRGAPGRRTRNTVVARAKTAPATSAANSATARLNPTSGSMPVSLIASAAR